MSLKMSENILEILQYNNESKICLFGIIKTKIFSFLRFLEYIKQCSYEVQDSRSL